MNAARKLRSPMRVACVLCIGAWCASGTFAIAARSDGGPASPGADSALSIETRGGSAARERCTAALRSWGEHVKPMIEKHAGRAFSADVEIKAVSKDELANILCTSVQEDLRREKPGQDETVLYVRAMDASYKIARRTLGMYNRTHKKVYVVAENLRTLCAPVAENKVLSGKILKLAVAHEMVHALQDQHVDTKAVYEGVHDHQAHLGVQCVIEGQAVVVTDAIAAELSMQDAGGQLWALVTSQDDAASSSGTGTISRNPADVLRQEPAMSESALVYRKGQALVRRVMSERGVEGVWELLAKPPRTIDEIDTLCDPKHGSAMKDR